jgi:hypothetical protein
MQKKGVSVQFMLVIGIRPLHSNKILINFLKLNYT